MTKIIRSNLVSSPLRRSCVLVLLLALFVPGCENSGDVATSIRRPAGQRPDIDAKAATGTLAIPAGQPFNITSFKSGQEGAARGESKAAAADGARCHVDASAGGTAWAEFQLGYCFDNTSGVPLRAAVKLHLAFAASQGDGTASRPTNAAEVAPQPQKPAAAGSQSSTATTTLKYFVKDTNGTILRQENLAAMDLQHGPQNANDEPTRVFDLQLPPDRGCYLVITGRTDVHAGDQTTAAANLEVQRCSMEIAWQPQAPMPTPAQPVAQPQYEKNAGAGQ